MSEPADKNRAVESASLDAVVKAMLPIVRIGATPAQIRHFAKTMRNAVVVEYEKRQTKDIMSSHYREDEDEV